MRAAGMTFCGLMSLATLIAGCRTAQPELKPAKQPEVASVPQLLAPAATRVTLLGDAALCERYRRALTRLDLEVEMFDGEAAAIAGLFALGACT